MQYILTLRSDIQDGYADISFMGNKWLGRHKGSGQTQELPVGAFVLSPIDVLIPDLAQAVATATLDALDEAFDDICEKVADNILSKLEETSGVSAESGELQEEIRGDEGDSA